MKSIGSHFCKAHDVSLPVRGAWVEMRCLRGTQGNVASLPVRGAWVEMLLAAEADSR